MKGLAAGFIYATSLGAVILAIENEYIIEGRGALLVLWGLAGLGLIFYQIHTNR